MRNAIRVRHYSRRTEKAYVAWIRRYIFFHGKRHPAEMGAPELTRFLTSLAVDRKCALLEESPSPDNSVFRAMRDSLIEILRRAVMIRLHEPELYARLVLAALDKQEGTS